MHDSAALGAGLSFELYYCAQTRMHTADLGRIADASYAGNISFHFDDGAELQKLDLPSVLGMPHSDTHLYVCGLAGFLEFVREQARVGGWADANVHFEYFARLRIRCRPDRTVSRW